MTASATIHAETLQQAWYKLGDHFARFFDSDRETFTVTITHAELVMAGIPHADGRENVDVWSVSGEVTFAFDRWEPALSWGHAS